jgi:hypothetical protein
MLAPDVMADEVGKTVSAGVLGPRLLPQKREGRLDFRGHVVELPEHGRLVGRRIDAEAEIPARVSAATRVSRGRVQP